MKILHITKKYPNALGGDAIVVQNLEKQQTKNGHEVFILTTNCDDIVEKDNLIKFGLKDTPANLDKITLRRIFSLIGLYFKSLKILKQIKPDIVHSHSVDMGFIMSFACRKYNIPIINTCHGVTFPDSQYSLFKRFTEKFFLRHSRFKKIFTVDINSLADFEKARIKNVIYIPNGVDLEKFNQKNNKNKGKIIFLFVGRLEKQKGLIYLIEAINLIKTKTLGFELYIIGEGSEEKYLKNLVAKLNLRKYIKFLGKKNMEEIKKYYSSSDAFVLPSIWEGFPLTLLEAWASKLPVIITNVGGISKICIDRENALIIPPRDPKKIATAMFTLIKNSEIREKLGENGRKLVEEKYSWKKIAKDVENLCNEVLKK